MTEAERDDEAVRAHVRERPRFSWPVIIGGTLLVAGAWKLSVPETQDLRRPELAARTYAQCVSGLSVGCGGGGGGGANSQATSTTLADPVTVTAVPVTTTTVAPGAPNPLLPTPPASDGTTGATDGTGTGGTGTGGTGTGGTGTGGTGPGGTGAGGTGSTGTGTGTGTGGTGGTGTGGGGSGTGGGGTGTGGTGRSGLPSPGPAESIGLPTLRQGSRGAQVRVLQQLLVKGGFNPGPIDGIFGPRTRAAVIGYQRKHGLLVDGIVGRQTWTSLRRL